MYENQLLDAVNQVATTLDAIRHELDALVGLLDYRLRPPARRNCPRHPPKGDPPAHCLVRYLAARRRRSPEQRRRRLRRSASRIVAYDEQLATPTVGPYAEHGTGRSPSGGVMASRLVSTTSEQWCVFSARRSIRTNTT